MKLGTTSYSIGEVITLCLPNAKHLINFIINIQILGRYLRTVRHLKSSQIYYRLYYTARNTWRGFTGFSPQLSNKYKRPELKRMSFPSYSAMSYFGDHTFKFLNQTKTFSSGIDWNFLAYGKLWNYNLLYFDYLHQPDIEREEKLRLIHDFIRNFDHIRFARDPYPISLRCINWIKFLVGNHLNDRQIEQALYRQSYLLLDNIEYHLQGNHLLENGCALLFGGVFFDDDMLLDKSQDILLSQLEEQILTDGAHFERSPMYHQLLLYRLMDCYNLLSKQSGKLAELQAFIKSKTEQMIGWLKNITFKSGSVPHVNDAAEGIAPSTRQLLDYAEQFGLKAETSSLHESGYRMIRQENYEWFIDAGNIGPDYIPGHAHSDTLSFVLHLRNQPVIVDTGISTYEECGRRVMERSTASHNTVKIEGQEQSEVWKSFRVGRRAHITKLEEEANYIVAEHNGYDYMDIIHHRRFKWSEKELYIEDNIKGKMNAVGMAFLHFHPSVIVKQKDERIIAGDVIISFSGQDKMQLNKYQYASGFNQLTPASMLAITFSNRLRTWIKLL